MKLIAIFIILVCFLENVEMRKEFKASMPKHFFDPEFLRVTFDLANETHDAGLKVEALRDLANLHFQIIFKTINSNFVIFNKTINLCFFARQRNSNIMFRLLFANILTSAKFKFECPFKKGIYEVEPRPFVTKNTASLFLPGYIPINEKLLFNSIGFTKINGQFRTIFNGTQVWKVVEVDD